MPPPTCRRFKCTGEGGVRFKSMCRYRTDCGSRSPSRKPMYGKTDSAPPPPPFLFANGELAVGGLCLRHRGRSVLLVRCMLRTLAHNVDGAGKSLSAAACVSRSKVKRKPFIIWAFYARTHTHLCFSVDRKRKPADSKFSLSLPPSPSPQSLHAATLLLLSAGTFPSPLLCPPRETNFGLIPSISGSAGTPRSRHVVCGGSLCFGVLRDRGRGGA